mmetsp:Transcript_51786/g.119014  ORF Transcript_51786/g.119014 Transcript_51786/m.119014 type:complete len:249 (-) Transcript_51786:1464-2210(-)
MVRKKAAAATARRDSRCGARYYLRSSWARAAIRRCGACVRSSPTASRSLSQSNVSCWIQMMRSSWRRCGTRSTSCGRWRRTRTCSRCSATATLTAIAPSRGETCTCCSSCAAAVRLRSCSCSAQRPRRSLRRTCCASSTICATLWRMCTLRRNPRSRTATSSRRTFFCPSPTATGNCVTLAPPHTASSCMSGGRRERRTRWPCRRSAFTSTRHRSTAHPRCAICTRRCQSAQRWMCGRSACASTRCSS